ncbi:MAG: beta-galactosidase [Ignisphaera sp.]
MQVSYDNGFLSVGGSRVFLMCGEVHYFRVPKDLWHDRLLKVRRAGFNCVSSYIPWNWHEVEEDYIVFDDRVFESPYESNLFSRDLESYIQMIKSLGMFFVARPGPYICSEWDSGGHPNWLYRKTKMFRSIDKDYIEAVEKWYRVVLPIIARYTVPRNGPTILLQIENEYFWGDVPYILKLYEIARKYVEDIPIVTNEDWFLEDTPIANTIDDYPVPWDIEEFDNKIKSYIKTQKGFLKMFMELEGGWFTYFGSLYPTSRGSIPAEWSETLLKTAIGLGINSVNIYMFHGGTNPGYYTGKYITSSYDYEAPVREWGELSQRYYVLKRIAMFIKTFSKLLTKTVPVDGAVEVSNKDVEVFARVSDSGAIAILRNLDIYPKLTKIIYRGHVYPYRNIVVISPRNAKIVLLDTEIEDTPFRILYTSSEPLLIERFGADTIFIVYGDVSEVGEIGIESSKPISIVYTEGMDVDKRNDRLVILSYVHSYIDSIAILESEGRKLYIVALSRDRASRTWYIDDVDPPIIVVSNIYFIGRTTSREDGLILEAEVDEESCGSILLVSSRPLSSIYVNSRSIEFENIHGVLYRSSLSQDFCRDIAQPKIMYGHMWRYREDIIDVDGREIEAMKPLEIAGYTSNGYYIYTIDFNIDRDVFKSLKNSYIYISYFNDYATAILNGKTLGSRYHTLEIDASNILKEGANRLTILLESTGHPNDGLVYIPNGIVGGIYLGKLEEIQLNDWRYIKIQTRYGRDFSMARFINNPEEVVKILNNIDAESSSDTANSLEKQGLYIKYLNIDKKRGRYILDLGKATYYSNYFYYPRALIFVNKRYVSIYTGPIDITEYLTEGINEIAVYIDWSRIALHPILKIYQHKVNGLWKVKPYTKGLEEKWYTEDLDDSSWSCIEIPKIFKDTEGRVLWIRNKIHIDYPIDTVAPLKLIIKASNVKILVFFNGQIIGRYVDEGPQREFYIPEPLLKNGLNTIALAVHVTSSRASIDSIRIEPFYVNKKLAIELEW